MIDELVANKTLSKRLNVTTRTLFRWAADPELNFPRPILIGSRRYFSVTEVEAWLATRRPGAVANAATERGPAIVPAAKLRIAKPSPIDRHNASEITEAADR